MAALKVVAETCLARDMALHCSIIRAGREEGGAGLPFQQPAVSLPTLGYNNARAPACMAGRAHILTGLPSIELFVEETHEEIYGYLLNSDGAVGSCHHPAVIRLRCSRQGPRPSRSR